MTSLLVPPNVTNHIRLEAIVPKCMCVDSVNTPLDHPLVPMAVRFKHLPMTHCVHRKSEASVKLERRKPLFISIQKVVIDADTKACESASFEMKVNMCHGSHMENSIRPFREGRKGIEGSV